MSKKKQNQRVRVFCEAQLGCMFIDYNNAYFDNILPIPNFKIRHSVKILGYFSYIYDEFGPIETIEISDFYAYTPNQLRDIMVHEMIHYYLYYIGEDVKLKHGKAFKKKARQLNKMYGLHVTPTIDLTTYKPRNDAPFLKRIYFRLIR